MVVYAYLFSEDYICGGRFLRGNCISAPVLQFLHGLVKFLVRYRLFLSLGRSLTRC